MTAVELPQKHMKFSDVSRFLDAKVKNNLCPSCGENDWLAAYGRLADDSMAVVSTHVLPMGTPFPNGSKSRLMVTAMPVGRTVLPLICKNCGYSRYFDFSIIVKWVNENPSDIDEQGHGDAESED